MAGYSTTPLAKKLGIKANFRVSFVNSPIGFREELGELSAGVTILPRAQQAMDLLLLFVKAEVDLRGRFQKLAQKLKPTGMLWVAWPKKSSGVETDLKFEVVQKIGLEAGLVDTKVCAVNDTWSGLRFVYRLKDRPHLTA